MKRWWTSTERPVAVVLLMGCCLHALAVFTNDLGLDAHVRINATITEAGAYVLPWGGLRHPNGTSWGAAPFAFSARLPWLHSPLHLKVMSSVATVALVGGLVQLIRQSGAHRPWYPLLAISIVLSPVWMFSTGRGYDEALLALLMLVSLWWVPSNARAAGNIGLRGLSLGVALGLVLALKGLDASMSVGAVAAAVLCSLVWGAWWVRVAGQGGRPEPTPARLMAACAGMVMAVISVAAFFVGPGSFSSVAEQPLVYVGSLAAALLIGGGLYLGVGCMLWPLVLRSNREHIAMTDRSAYLWSAVGALGGAIVCYTAVLWTYESALWGAPWASTVIRLGNNGRYMTLLVPLIWAALAADGRLQSTRDLPSRRTMLVALLLVLPFTAVTAVWGHQVWSADAGRALHDELDENGTFLMVAEPTLAMHHLYVMRTHVDGSGVLNITGAWATPEAIAASSMDLLENDAIIVGPNTEFSPGTSWVERTEQKVPLSVPTIQTGAWRLYTKA